MIEEYRIKYKCQVSRENSSRGLGGWLAPRSSVLLERSRGSSEDRTDRHLSSRFTPRVNVCDTGMHRRHRRACLAARKLEHGAGVSRHAIRRRRLGARGKPVERHALRGCRVCGRNAGRGDGRRPGGAGRLRRAPPAYPDIRAAGRALPRAFARVGSPPRTRLSDTIPSSPTTTRASPRRCSPAVPRSS